MKIKVCLYELKMEEEQSYRAAFDCFDWTKSGTIPVKVNHYTSWASIPANISFYTCQGQFLYLSRSGSIPVKVSFYTCQGQFLFLSRTVFQLRSFSIPVKVSFYSCQGQFLYLSRTVSIPVKVSFYTCQGQFLYLSKSVSESTKDSHYLFLCNSPAMVSEHQGPYNNRVNRCKHCVFGIFFKCKT